VKWRTASPAGKNRRTDVTSHLRLVGARRADREAWVASNLPGAIVARCHQRLRGPCTGVDTVLAQVLPEAARRWPDLVERHRFELLYGMPELAEIIGPAPRTLAADAPFRQRTRFYGSNMIRCVSQGIVTFLLTHAALRVAAGDTPMVLVMEEISAAELTGQEFAALLLRRCDAAALRVVVSGADQPLAPELADEVGAHAELVRCASAPRPGPGRAAAELAAAYVGGHGTSDDPAEIEAYERCDPARRARLHDEQADLLEPGAGPGLRAGAIAYHREHGSDPGGAGSAALAAAQQYCVETGFSGAVVDLGLRGRAVTDPVRDAPRYCELTMQAAHALVPLGRLAESMDLYLELRRRYTSAKIQMNTSYAIAMMHTRFLRPRDHEAAIGWQNNAIALAGLLPDARDRLVFGVFQDNALALIEMHRGNLRPALDLVAAGIARLDAEIGDDEWALHRSQLLYNGARLKAALGDTDAAYADFSTLVALDPYYTDYLCERARISRQAGDFAAALDDYDRAAELAPPYPELYFNRGTAKAALGDTAGALADFGYVLDMEPRDVETRLSRAELLLGAGEVDAALADVLAGLALVPAEPRLLCLRGAVHLERDELAVALDALDRAIALDPEYPAALLNRAVAHYRSGDGSRAVDDLTRTLDLAGEDPDILANRALAYAATGRPDLALADLDRALELPGADAEEILVQRDACREAAPGSHVSVEP
jgi:tetratricopeptide (TPR) repeat protein